MTFRIFSTTDIGQVALQRLRDKGWDLEVYDHVEPPPRALVLEKVKSGIDALIKACVVRAAALASLAALVEWIDAPSMFELMVPLTIFGYGQGLVMAQLFSTVLRSVAHSRAGSASGVLVTVQQVANAIGVAVVGAVYFGAQAAHSQRVALIAALITLIAAVALCAAALEWLRRCQSPAEARAARR